MAGSPWHDGVLNREDQLFRRARPHCSLLERHLAESVKRHEPGRRISVLELGAGTGFSTAAILRLRRNLALTALDNDARYLAQGRRNLRAWKGLVRFVGQDLLSYLERRPAASFDAVATKFTLHNLERRYRGAVLRHVHRVLRPGGLFANADKYAREPRAQAAALQEQLERYMEVFLPLGERVMFQETVAHYMDDESESRVMREKQSVKDMRRLGFRGIKRLFRRGMDAVYLARK